MRGEPRYDLVVCLIVQRRWGDPHLLQHAARRAPTLFNCMSPCALKEVEVLVAKQRSSDLMQLINSKLCWLLRFLLPTLPAFDCCFAAWLLHAGQAQFTMVCYNQLICQHPMQTIGCAHNLQHCIVAFPIASFILGETRHHFPCQCTTSLT